MGSRAWDVLGHWRGLRMALYSACHIYEEQQEVWMEVVEEKARGQNNQTLTP